MTNQYLYTINPKLSFLCDLSYHRLMHRYSFVLCDIDLWYRYFHLFCCFLLIKPVCFPNQRENHAISTSRCGGWQGEPICPVWRCFIDREIFLESNAVPQIQLDHLWTEGRLCDQLQISSKRMRHLQTRELGTQGETLKPFSHNRMHLLSCPKNFFFVGYLTLVADGPL